MQVIKRYIMHSKKTAFIVEHDFIMAAYLADRVIVYEGIPSREAVARCPQSLLTGVTGQLLSDAPHLRWFIANVHLPACMQSCRLLGLRHRICLPKLLLDTQT